MFGSAKKADSRKAQDMASREPAADVLVVAPEAYLRDRLSAEAPKRCSFRPTAACRPCR